MRPGSSNARTGDTNHGTVETADLPRMSTVYRLTILMGQEALSNWMQQVRASSGRVPTRGEMDCMLATCEVYKKTYGEETFRQMIHADYGGVGEGDTGTVSAAPRSRVGAAEAMAAKVRD